MTEEQLINKFTGTRLNLEIDLLLELEAEMIGEIDPQDEGQERLLRVVQKSLRDRKEKLREIQ